MLGRSVGCLLSRSLARSVAPSLARLSGRTVWLQAGLSCPLHGKPMDIWVPGSTQLSLEQSPELPLAWRAAEMESYRKKGLNGSLYIRIFDFF